MVHRAEHVEFVACRAQPRVDAFLESDVLRVPARANRIEGTPAPQELGQSLDDAPQDRFARFTGVPEDLGSGRGGHVRRVRYDAIEAAPLDRLVEIPLRHLHVGTAIQQAIEAGEMGCPARNVGRDHARRMAAQHERADARAGAEIEHVCGRARRQDLEKP